MDYSQFKCKYCTFQTDEESFYLRHIKDIHESFRCNLCDFACNSNLHLKEHYNEKHTPAKCLTCHHTLVDGVCPVKSCGSYVGNIKCEICNYVTTEVKLLISHIKEKHDEIYSLTSPIQSVVKCNFCDYTASNSSIISSHIVENHETETCDYCPFVANENQDLKDHTYQKHPEVIMMHTMAS